MFTNTVWRYWAQGWGNAPYIINLCSKSVDKFAKSDFNIINLDDNNLHKYINLNKTVPRINEYPIQIRSDLIRLLLLKQYGGIWMDATVYLASNLHFFLNRIESDFFCYHYNKDNSSMSNWFLASNKKSYIIDKLCHEFINLLNTAEFFCKAEPFFSNWKPSSSPHYFIFHKTYKELAKADTYFFQEVQKIPHIPSESQHLVQFYYGMETNLCVDLKEKLQKSIVMQKLNYRIDVPKNDENSTLAYLENHISDKDPCSEVALSYLAMRCGVMYNHQINDPSVLSHCGALASMSNLNISNDKSRFHYVFNFNSHKSQAVQMIVPCDSNRLFIRNQTKNAFSKAREVAYSDEISELKNHIMAIEKNISQICFNALWCGLLTNSNIDKRVTPIMNYNRHCFQFVIIGIPEYLHYEILFSQCKFYVSLDYEHENRIISVKKLFCSFCKKNNFSLLESPSFIRIRQEVNQYDVIHELNDLISLTFDEVKKFLVNAQGGARQSDSGVPV